MPHIYLLSNKGDKCNEEIRALIRYALKDLAFSDKVTIITFKVEIEGHKTEPQIIANGLSGDNNILMMEALSKLNGFDIIVGEILSFKSAGFDTFRFFQPATPDKV